MPFLRIRDTTLRLVKIEMKTLTVRVVLLRIVQSEATFSVDQFAGTDRKCFVKFQVSEDFISHL